jgi:hypothetical protein
MFLRQLNKKYEIGRMCNVNVKQNRNANFYRKISALKETTSVASG